MTIFFPDKLISQAAWLVKIRWFIFLCAILIVSVGYYFSIADLNYRYLYLTSILLVPLNLLYYFDLVRIGRKNEEDVDWRVKININLQVVFDYIILALLLHFSGGVENPCIIFFVFHMIIGSIILPPKNAYLLAGLATFLFLSLTLAESLGFLHHYSINSYITEMIVNEPVYLFGSLAIFVVTSFLAVFLAVTLSGKLRITKILLNQSNQILLEKDKIKNEFIQRVTHDIKGSLSTISSCLAVVDQQIQEPVSPQNADFVNKALVRTNKLKLFLNDLLMLTKMRLDNRFETTDVSINEIITNVIGRVSPEAEEKNMEFTLSMPDEKFIISGIEVSVEEAIFNIVQNAVKYTPEGGKVGVKVQRINDKILIEIADSGYGIPEKNLPFIFDEFYRADNISMIEGTGLGLSLVKAIVDRHRGSITVKSVENSGTTFTIMFDAK